MGEHEIIRLLRHIRTGVYLILGAIVGTGCAMIAVALWVWG